ncbi:hypothetical protein NPJ88_011560 [Halomonas elongata]|uniref:hypothetical protein n=1 Tax=Halomonas elongata TaxID=2746 RepID=UPI00255AB9C7|nr:hypothetical protein [Halomonas elongata]MDL4862973.1 hypothetical protein [Halomonas elongata]
MEFRFRVTRDSYHSERDAEKLLKLTEAGFKVEPRASTLGHDRVVTNATEGVLVDLSTLEDLVSLQKHWGCQLIFDAEEAGITLYDDYLE